MALIKQISNGSSLAKRAKREATGDSAGNVLNVRKMVRFTSGGHGATVGRCNLNLIYKTNMDTRVHTGLTREKNFQQRKEKKNENPVLQK